MCGNFRVQTTLHACILLPKKHGFLNFVFVFILHNFIFFSLWPFIDIRRTDIFKHNYLLGHEPINSLVFDHKIWSAF